VRIVARLTTEGAIRQVSGRAEQVAEIVATWPWPEMLDRDDLRQDAADAAEHGRRRVRTLGRGTWMLVIERPMTPAEVLREREETRNAPLEDDPLAQHLMRQAIADGTGWACDEVRETLGLGPNGDGAARAGSPSHERTEGGEGAAATVPCEGAGATTETADGNG